MINYKFYTKKTLGEAFEIIGKEFLYNKKDEDRTTILPLLETGSNNEGDVPHFCTLVFDGENPIGMALITDRDHEGLFYSVGHIYVKDVARGRGIGSELIKKCLDSSQDEIYWYYTPKSFGLYQHHHLEDVVLFESMNGIFHEDSQELLTFENPVNQEFIESPIKKHKLKHKH